MPRSENKGTEGPLGEGTRKFPKAQLAKWWSLKPCGAPQIPTTQPRLGPLNVLRDAWAIGSLGPLTAQKKGKKKRERERKRERKKKKAFLSARRGEQRKRLGGAGARRPERGARAEPEPKRTRRRAAWPSPLALSPCDPEDRAARTPEWTPRRAAPRPRPSAARRPRPAQPEPRAPRPTCPARRAESCARGGAGRAPGVRVPRGHGVRRLAADSRWTDGRPDAASAPRPRAPRAGR
jgi:hypothetical protein